MENVGLNRQDALLHTQEVRRSSRRAPTKPPSKRKDLRGWIEYHRVRLSLKNKQVSHNSGPGVDRNEQPSPGGITVIPVMLTRGYHALVSVEDYERVSAIKWRACIDERSQIVYARAHLPGSGKRGVDLIMHRFIMNAAPGQRIDHRDGDGLHNWRENLRPATNAQNVRNQRGHITGKATSKFKGVYRLPSGLFRAQIMCQYRKINLGSFTTEQDAAMAYDANARKLHGEFARLNFAE